uniref:Uncharacterized protein n=1 Tax=uncultured Desulfobacterium sp. TaxID=201089 RepID=E1Y9L0_9BACT|nr:unknown protein [uncultured Desulfobacterium sp.]
MVRFVPIQLSDIHNSRPFITVSNLAANKNLIIMHC